MGDPFLNNWNNWLNSWGITERDVRRHPEVPSLLRRYINQLQAGANHSPGQGSLANGNPYLHSRFGYSGAADIIDDYVDAARNQAFEDEMVDHVMGDGFSQLQRDKLEYLVHHSPDLFMFAGVEGHLGPVHGEVLALSGLDVGSWGEPYAGGLAAVGTGPLAFGYEMTTAGRGSIVLLDAGNAISFGPYSLGAFSSPDESGAFMYIGLGHYAFLGFGIGHR